MSAKTWWLLISFPIWLLTISTMLGAIVSLISIVVLLRGMR